MKMKIENTDQKTVSMATTANLTKDTSRTISTGSVPMSSDGIMNVKMNRMPPWNAPPWNSAGLKNSSNRPLVTALESINKKLVEKIAMAVARNTMVVKAASITIKPIW